jgi:hypothetical protein
VPSVGQHGNKAWNGTDIRLKRAAGGGVIGRRRVDTKLSDQH